MPDTNALPTDIAVAIVGAGQAGLSLSWFPRARGIEHVVLERHVPVQSWRDERWASFRLVTPNGQCRLPGHPYRGPDPNGFLAHDEVVAYLESFIASFDPPVIPHVEVRALVCATDGFRLETSAGPLRARKVVVATGGHHTPVIPADAAGLPPGIRRLTAAEYRDPAQLPPGGVLVAGSGLPGAQIAEDLRAAGRDVHLAVGAAPRISRRHRGRDVSEWLERMGLHDRPVGKHELGEGVRDTATGVVSGLDGGRDIDLRARGPAPVWTAARHRRRDRAFRRRPRRQPRPRGRGQRRDQDLDRPVDHECRDRSARRAALHTAARDAADARSGAPGSARSYGASAFGRRSAGSQPPCSTSGRPVHRRGVMVTPGLYFLGLPWLHSWGSGRMSGVARDAEYLAQRIGGGYR